MPRQTKKRRKLTLHEVGRCKPTSGKNSDRCLPAAVYKKASRATLKACGKGADHCILDSITMDDAEKKRLRASLRPRRPKAWEADPDMWLDNYNIQHVMKQYEEAVPWFRFLGVFPIDFSAPDPYTDKTKCLNAELCSLKLKEEYARGRRGLGAVFNLDPHDKGGSHWVGLYIDLHNIKTPQISYYDSYGYKTPAMIARLMRSFTLEIPGCVLGFNARRFQYGESECGMFSMYFLICMIAGIPFKEFCKDAVRDGFMLELRKVLFSR